MRANVRRTMSTGVRSAEQAHAHPSEDPRFLALLAQLDELNERARAGAAAQRDGFTMVRGSTALKQTILAEIRHTHLPHLARVASHLATAQPDLEPALRVRGDARTIRGFLTTARTIIAAVQANRDLLVQHGLVESVLDDFGAKTDRFEAALMHGVEGRRQHVGATAELQRVAEEIQHVVRVMDGFQRLRFADDPEQLAAWTSASTVESAPAKAPEDDGGAGPAGATAGGGTAPAGSAASGRTPAPGDVRPAA
jgi:hypothetical protein